MRLWIILLLLSGCGGVAWNTTVADAPSSRWAMLASVVPGQTTEKRFVAQWGNPTQKIREGAQVSYVYRNMGNPRGYPAPQFGDSAHFVVVMFQYGLAIGGYSSDTQGCRATFPPRPPGPNFDNPTTVHAVNCSGIPNPPGPGEAGRELWIDPRNLLRIGWPAPSETTRRSGDHPQGVTPDVYAPAGNLK
jgi:hypothetical protein